MHPPKNLSPVYCAEGLIKAEKRPRYAVKRWDRGLGGDSGKASLEKHHFVFCENRIKLVKMPNKIVNYLTIVILLKH